MMTSLAALASPLGLFFLMTVLMIGGLILAFSGTLGNKLANKTTSYFSKEAAEERRRRKTERAGNQAESKSKSTMERIAERGGQVIQDVSGKTEAWLNAQRKGNPVEVNPVMEGA